MNRHIVIEKSQRSMLSQVLLGIAGAVVIFYFSVALVGKYAAKEAPVSLQLCKTATLGEATVILSAKNKKELEATLEAVILQLKAVQDESTKGEGK